MRVFVAGGSGFVGRRLVERLLADPRVEVVASHKSRAPACQGPRVRWVKLDLHDEDALAAALAGCDRAAYLVHLMRGPDRASLHEREGRAAALFARAAARQGCKRIVYLGGVQPRGAASHHLSSRLHTGALLRQGSVPTTELRAGMIIGSGSVSWQIVRDLGARLPVMVLPRWLQARSQPVAVDDVVAALTHALLSNEASPGCFTLPGLEVLSGREILTRIARLHGVVPVMIPVPFLSPRLSSHWIRLVTRADFTIARQLVDGVATDLLDETPSYWPRMPSHHCLDFDEAARRALSDDEATLSPRARRFEALVRGAARIMRRPPDVAPRIAR